MNADQQKVLDSIAEALPTSAPTDAQTAAMQAAMNGTKDSVKDFRLKSLLLAGLHVEDSLTRYPNLDKEALIRLVANEYLYLSAFLVRSFKRRGGDEISPARFALVGYGVAEHILSQEWSTESDQILQTSDISLRAEIDRLSAATINTPFIDIVFDGPPENEGGRFVEVEDHAGASVSVGVWFKREDGYWVLRIQRS